MTYNVFGGTLSLPQSIKPPSLWVSVYLTIIIIVH